MTRSGSKGWPGVALTTRHPQKWYPDQVIWLFISKSQILPRCLNLLRIISEPSTSRATALDFIDITVAEKGYNGWGMKWNAVIKHNTRAHVAKRISMLIYAFMSLLGLPESFQVLHRSHGGKVSSHLSMRRSCWGPTVRDTVLLHVNPHSIGSVTLHVYLFENPQNVIPTPCFCPLTSSSFSGASQHCWREHSIIVLKQCTSYKIRCGKLFFPPFMLTVDVECKLWAASLIHEVLKIL